ncbi:AraC family transcriptional regulator [Mycobacterium sp. NPDC050853]|uniref:AraC family transcriptional regulator n=1 Tax=Mycobacteriaceae TaxID=1762 RepID=UPI0015DF5D97|nr:AraC family transcriptional regulator ligand-binding domain-containing protein [Mycobacteroides sp. LB1]
MAEVSIPARWGTAAVDQVRQRGADAAKMLMEAGISPRLLEGEPVSISPEQVRTLVHTGYSRTNDESFGMSTIPVPSGTIRMLLFSLATARTLTAVFDRWTAFGEAVLGAPTFVTSRSGRRATISVDVSTLRLPGIPGTEWAMTIAVLMLSWMTMRPVRVEYVHLPHPQPDGHSEHSDIFNAPIRFDSDSAALVLDADLVDAPILRTESEITTLFDHPDKVWFETRDFQTELPDRIRRIVQTGVGHRVAAVGEIAGMLGITSSALQRTLRAEFGTSVREIRDATLRDEAIESLESEKESLTDLSSRLGFSEVSAFTRAFRRWTGSSPAQYRACARSVK